MKEGFRRPKEIGEVGKTSTALANHRHDPTSYVRNTDFIFTRRFLRFADRKGQTTQKTSEDLHREARRSEKKERKTKGNLRKPRLPVNRTDVVPSETSEETDQTLKCDRWRAKGHSSCTLTNSQRVSLGTVIQISKNSGSHNLNDPSIIEMLTREKRPESLGVQIGREMNGKEICQCPQRVDHRFPIDQTKLRSNLLEHFPSGR